MGPGDDRYHYSDNSHRWVPPDGVDDKSWRAEMRSHMDGHRLTMGGPVPNLAAATRGCGARPKRRGR